MPSEQPAKPNLGRLEKIDLNQYWQTDELEFTHWLTQDDNIQLLGEAIGLELEVVLDAAQVEELRTDLLCRDLATGGWVIIGNQLQPTDEPYLGRLLTYAADINAAAIVWVSSQFLPEHRAVFDWLNQTMQPNVQCFGLELELWRIGTSAMAATFKLVTASLSQTAAQETESAIHSLKEAATPFLESKDAVTQSSEAFGNSLDEAEAEPSLPEPVVEPLSEVEQQNLAFWVSLCDQLEQRGSIVKPSAPVTGERIGFAIGRAGFRLYAAIDRDQESIQTGLWLFDEDAQAYFGLLLTRQDLVEAEMGNALTWDNHTDEPNCSIYATLPNVNIEDRDHWSDYLRWVCENLEHLHETFSERIKVLNAFDYRKPLASLNDPLQDLLVLPD